jgi:hypothetical protein
MEQIVKNGRGSSFLFFLCDLEGKLFYVDPKNTDLRAGDALFDPNRLSGITQPLSVQNTDHGLFVTIAVNIENLGFSGYV